MGLMQTVGEHADAGCASAYAGALYALFGPAEDAALLLDGAGRVVWRSPASDAVLAEAGVVALPGESGLRFSGPQEDDAVAALADVLAQPPAAEALVVRRGAPRTPPVLLKFRKLAPDLVGLVVCRPANPRRPREHVLAAAFGLTRAETAVALDLLENLSAKQIAKRRTLSEATIRTHMRAIYAKLGVGRLVSVVSVLNNCARL